MYRTKSELMAKTGCKSLHDFGLAKNSETGFEPFLGQCAQCVFTMGACHILAVALYERLRREGLAVLSVFRILNSQPEFKHYVVGFQNGPYVDVHLEWQTVDQIRAFWETGDLYVDESVSLDKSKKPECRLAFCADRCAPGQSACCAKDTFISLGRDKAASYLAANDAKIRCLVDEGREYQRKQS